MIMMIIIILLLFRTSSTRFDWQHFRRMVAYKHIWRGFTWITCIHSHNYINIVTTTLCEALARLLQILESICLVHFEVIYIMYINWWENLKVIISQVWGLGGWWGLGGRARELYRDRWIDKYLIVNAQSTTEKREHESERERGRDHRLHHNDVTRITLVAVPVLHATGHSSSIWNNRPANLPHSFPLAIVGTTWSRLMINWLRTAADCVRLSSAKAECISL